MKPKENLIAKIDTIHGQLHRFPDSGLDMTLTTAITKRCHTMNIHKAKVVYFKRIKQVLSEALELARREKADPASATPGEFRRIEKELRILLDANNG